MRLRLFPRSEVRSGDAQCGELGDVGPGLLCLDRRGGQRAQFLKQRIVQDGGPARRSVRHLGGRAEALRERLHFGLRVLDAAARSEAKVQVEVAAGGNHVASGEAFDPRDRHHLAKDQLADADVPRGVRGEMREQRACLVDGVVALPRTCRMGAPARERDRRVHRPAAAELQGKIGRLQAQGERRAPQVRPLFQSGAQPVLRDGPLFAIVEEQQELERQRRAIEPLPELDHHRQRAFHVAGPAAVHAAVLAASGEVAFL